jgi:hypothetical protein
VAAVHQHRGFRTRGLDYAPHRGVDGAVDVTHRVTERVRHPAIELRMLGIVQMPELMSGALRIVEHGEEEVPISL